MTIIEQMVECGLLEPESQADNVDDLIEKGFDTLIEGCPVTKGTDDNFSGVYIEQPSQSPLDWSLVVANTCIDENRLPLSHVFKAADQAGGAELAALVAYVLNKHDGITGPWRWDTLDYKAGGPNEDDGEEWVPRENAEADEEQARRSEEPHV